MRRRISPTPSTVRPIRGSPTRSSSNATWVLQDLKAKHGKVGILFVGDLITDGWRGGKGKEIFDKYYGGLDPLNIGIGGDRTQHILSCRLDRGEVEGISPKVAVLMIGTNNLGGNTSNTMSPRTTT